MMNPDLPEVQFLKLQIDAIYPRPVRNFFYEKIQEDARVFLEEIVAKQQAELEAKQRLQEKRADFLRKFGDPSSKTIGPDTSKFSFRQYDGKKPYLEEKPTTVKRSRIEKLITGTVIVVGGELISYYLSDRGSNYSLGYGFELLDKYLAEQKKKERNKA